MSRKLKSIKFTQLNNNAELFNIEQNCKKFLVLQINHENSKKTAYKDFIHRRKKTNHKNFISQGKPKASKPTQNFHTQGAAEKMVQA
jgi:hypothetical protein